MINKQISPGELAPGLFVTVLENKPIIDYSTENYGDIKTITTVNSTVNRSGMGDVLRILAVDLPYIAAKVENESRILPYKIDTRQTILMELSEDYVKALCPHLFKKNENSHCL